TTHRLSLHDALPIYCAPEKSCLGRGIVPRADESTPVLLSNHEWTRRQRPSRLALEGHARVKPEKGDRKGQSISKKTCCESNADDAGVSSLRFALSACSIAKRRDDQAS